MKHLHISVYLSFEVCVTKLLFPAYQLMCSLSLAFILTRVPQENWTDRSNSLAISYIPSIYIYIHTFIYKYIYTYIHTYIHIYIRSLYKIYIECVCMMCMCVWYMCEWERKRVRFIIRNWLLGLRRLTSPRPAVGKLKTRAQAESVV